MDTLVHSRRVPQPHASTTDMLLTAIADVADSMDDEQRSAPRDM